MFDAGHCRLEKQKQNSIQIVRVSIEVGSLLGVVSRTNTLY